MKTRVYALIFLVQLLFQENHGTGCSLNFYLTNNTRWRSELDIVLKFVQDNHHPVTITTTNNSKFLESKHLICSKDLYLQWNEKSEEILQKLIPLLNPSQKYSQAKQPNFNGALLVVKFGLEVHLKHKDSTTLDFIKVVDFSKIEETIPRKPFSSSWTRLFFIWAILQNRFNFSSITLKRYEYLRKKPSPLSKGYKGHFLCVHCTPPNSTTFGHDKNIRILSTRQPSVQIMYCRSSTVIGIPGLIDIYIKSCHPTVWALLLLASLFYGLILHRHRDFKYVLDFWMGVLGFRWQLSWTPSSLHIGLLALTFLNCELLCWITTESVSPLPPSRIALIASFFSPPNGFRLFTYDIRRAAELVSEYPEQFAKFGVGENFTEDDIKGVVFLNKGKCRDSWPVRCVANLATKIQPRISVGTMVGSRFASQNILGIEYALEGAAQCDVVQEPFSSSWKAFWFKGPEPGIGALYRATHSLMQAGIHEFWEDFYFAGGDRHVGEMKRNRAPGSLTPGEVVRKLSTLWRFYRVIQLHAILLSACGVYFILEILNARRNRVKVIKI